jgi:superfamily II DNA or RNA helicase
LSQLTIKGLFGKILETTTTYDLQKKNLLADLTIKCVKLNYDDREREIVKKLSYPDEMKYLVANEKRNEFIASLAWGQLGNCLVLFNTIKHGKRLYEILRKRNENGTRKVFLIYGGVGAEEREKIRKIVTVEKNAILVASYGTLSTGVNIPSISSMIFSIGSKSSIRVIQSIGRGLRISPDGKSTTLYDIIDDLSYKSRENFALKHATERVSIYIKERFNFKVSEVEFYNRKTE